MTMPIPECATPVSAPQPKEVNTRLPAIGRLSALPRPFLKWAGSKQGLLRHIVTAVPSTFGTYYEPFLGSGALFFHLSPEKAKISDSCAPLIQTYLSVRDNCAEVSRRIAKIKIDKDSYYRVRDIRFVSDIERATYFIYLNKTCWNGLYRVNSRGEFNVPYGTSWVKMED
jgi:DNA adenine methylase